MASSRVKTLRNNRRPVTKKGTKTRNILSCNVVRATLFLENLFEKLQKNFCLIFIKTISVLEFLSLSVKQESKRTQCQLWGTCEHVLWHTDYRKEQTEICHFPWIPDTAIQIFKLSLTNFCLETVSLYSSSWHENHLVEQTGLKLRRSPPSASWVL